MADLKSQFLELTRKKYIDQAIWFLNGFWKNEAEKESENIWAFTQKFIELDSKKKEGNELDEFWSHKFLESLGETLTVIQLREKLRKIDVDANGKMALLEYLAFKYNKSIQSVVDAPQGENKEELEKAQAELRRVQEALENLRQAEETQKRRLEEQKKAEEEVKRAEEELRLAVQELKSQEDSYNHQIQELTRKSEEGTSLVAKNKAKQELAQLKQENPLPLRRAKITQEAALRRVEKQRIACEATTAELEAATRKVEESVRQTEDQMQKAEAYLNEVKRKGGSGEGSIWWIQRELTEAKKYMPKRKQ